MAAAAAAPPPRLLVVSAVALIRTRGGPPPAAREVLLAQRPAGKHMGGRWEFPGGKVEPGESPEAALVRELGEELAIAVRAEDLRPLTFASHAYEGQDGAGGFHLLMPVYACERWEGEVGAEGAEGQRLAWATAATLGDFAMPPADVPLLGAIGAALRPRDEADAR